jgi:hypothetical protein
MQARVSIECFPSVFPLPSRNTLSTSAQFTPVPRRAAGPGDTASSPEPVEAERADLPLAQGQGGRFRIDNFLKALREVVWVNPGTFGYGDTVKLPAACR